MTFDSLNMDDTPRDPLSTLNVDEVAELLKTKADIVVELIRRGRIRAGDIGLKTRSRYKVSRAELARFLQSVESDEQVAERSKPGPKPKRKPLPFVDED